MAEHLSENFTYEEMTYSDTAKAKGIPNIPSTYHKRILKHTCQYLLEKIRALLNEKYRRYKGKEVKYVSLKITSGYRSPLLNSKVGGSSTSQHVTGEAADIEATIVFKDGRKEVLPYNVLYEDIKVWVKEKRMSVDQCIQERNSTGACWVHTSLPPQIKDCRGQFMKYEFGMYRLDCILK